MNKNKPSLAARAVATMISDWSIFRDGDYLSTNLNLAGFETIGHGNFGAVIKGLPNQVIKVFSLNDYGYQYLIKYAMTNPGLHLPEIFSFTTSGNHGIVEMEQLVHRTKTAVSVSNYVDQVKAGYKPKGHWGDLFNIEISALNYAIKEYNKNNKNKLQWDLHEGNILFRDKIPILCDVIYGEKI